MEQSLVAVVVGVGPGLGAAVARRFARGGFAVALVARSRESIAPVATDIERAGGTALGVPADTTDQAAVGTAFARVRDALGAPEVLVYNAGFFAMGGILDIAPETFETAWKANCFGAFLAAREVLPAMVERGRGTVLLTGATASLRGSANFACLAVGKFGLRALAQTLAREFGPRGVHVAHVVVDGAIDTPRIRAFLPDREPHTLLAPDAIAETYWQLHCQDRTAWTLELDLRPAVERF
jgi:NAD(P)-dependent dehydrogenase (short-subunit alcohol dehydrogenase family)